MYCSHLKTMSTIGVLALAAVSCTKRDGPAALPPVSQIRTDLTSDFTSKVNGRFRGSELEIDFADGGTGTFYHTRIYQSQSELPAGRGNVRLECLLRGDYQNLKFTKIEDLKERTTRHSLEFSFTELRQDPEKYVARAFQNSLEVAPETVNAKETCLRVLENEKKALKDFNRMSVGVNTYEENSIEMHRFGDQRLQQVQLNMTRDSLLIKEGTQKDLSAEMLEKFSGTWKSRVSHNGVLKEQLTYSLDPEKRDLRISGEVDAGFWECLFRIDLKAKVKSIQVNDKLQFSFELDSESTQIEFEINAGNEFCPNPEEVRKLTRLKVVDWDFRGAEDDFGSKLALDIGASWSIQLRH